MKKAYEAPTLTVQLLHTEEIMSASKEAHDIEVNFGDFWSKFTT